eukprot:298727_1
MIMTQLIWILIVVLCTTLIINCSGNSGAGVYGNSGAQYKDGANALVYYNTQNGNVTTVSKPIDNDDTNALQSTIDQINNIYYYLTDIKQGLEWYSALIPFNLSNPTHPMKIIEMPLCWTSTGFNDIGEQFISNPMNGDIYFLCHSKKNFKNESDLYRLTWNNIEDTLNITLIRKYNVGDTATDNFMYPTIFDSKRNRLWAVESYYSNLLNGTYMNNFDVINGSIYKQINIDDWKLQTGIYSYKLDTIVSVNTTTVSGGNSKYYLQINVLFSDPLTTDIVQNIGKIEVTKYYCRDVPLVYTMDVENNIWYQLMYRRTDNSMCLSNNPVLTGDLLAIDIENGKLISDSSICQNDLTNNRMTCPISIEFWNQ